MPSGDHAVVLRACDAVRTAAHAGHPLHLARRPAGADVWVCLGVARAGARYVHYVRRLIVASGTRFYGTTAAEEVWRIAVGADGLHASPVDRWVSIPRPLPRPGRRAPGRCMSMRLGATFQRLCTAHRDVATVRHIERTDRRAFVTFTGGRWSPAAVGYSTEYLTRAPSNPTESLEDGGGVGNAPQRAPTPAPTEFLDGRAVLQRLDGNVTVADATGRPRGRRTAERPAWRCACGAEARVRAGPDDDTRVCWDCFTAILD